MRKIQRGEITTIITIGSLVFILIATIASTFFFKKPQTTSTKASGACSSPNGCDYSSMCICGTTSDTGCTPPKLCCKSCASPTPTSKPPTATPKPPTATPKPPTATPTPVCNGDTGCGACGGPYGTCRQVGNDWVVNCKWYNGWEYCSPTDPTSTPKPPTPTPKPGTPTPKPPTSTPKPGTPTPKPPTSTPKPGTPTPTPVQNCESCSSLAGKENCDVKWYDPDGKCDSDFYNNRTEDCSATSTCSSAVRNCNRCSSLAGKKHCRVYWTDTTSGNCTANFYNNRQMNCSASSGCPEGNLTPTPTPTVTSGPTPTITSIPPTPTGNPSCICKTDNTCKMNTCTFDKYGSGTGINYTDPVKCSLSPLLFATSATPSAGNKNSWCQRTKRTKGDADGNGVVDDSDYYLYVGAANGGQIPATANPDFNGDGEVGAGDRVIIMKILHP